MTTTRKTTRKAAPKAEDTLPEVIEHDDTDTTPEESAAAAEVDEEGEDTPPRRTFTIEVNGETVELEDRWDRDGIPGAMMLLNKPEYSQKYGPIVMEQLIGEDQLMVLLEGGISTRELAGIIPAWGKARGVGNA